MLDWDQILDQQTMINDLAMSAGSMLLHNIKRFAGVLLIAVLLIGIPYLVYHKGYSQGYSKGYAQAVKDRPTYGNVGTVINDHKDEFKAIGMTFNIWKLKLKLGI